MRANHTKSTATLIDVAELMSRPATVPVRFAYSVPEHRHQGSGRAEAAGYEEEQRERLRSLSRLAADLEMGLGTTSEPMQLKALLDQAAAVLHSYVSRNAN